MSEQIEQATAAPGEKRQVKLKLITADKVCQQFIDAGIVPTMTRRVVLDLEVGKIPRLFFETAGDERLLNLNVAAGLELDLGE